MALLCTLIWFSGCVQFSCCVSDIAKYVKDLNRKDNFLCQLLHMNNTQHFIGTWILILFGIFPLLLFVRFSLLLSMWYFSAQLQRITHISRGWCVVIVKHFLYLPDVKRHLNVGDNRGNREWQVPMYCFSPFYRSKIRNTHWSNQIIAQGMVHWTGYVASQHRSI